jgi:uncharacterized protein DUF6159
VGRISHTFQFMRASWEVLKKDKLLLFPVFSGLACMLVLATFIVPLFIGELAQEFFGTIGVIGAVAVGFAYYVVTYAVVFFFNTAVIGCAVKRLRGGDPTVGDGFSIAFKRLPQILGWAVISATVGMILSALEENKIIGRIASMILGAAWSMTTFFAVPILVVEGKGPVQAIRESMALLKSTWGAQAAGNFSFGLIFFLLALPLIGIIYLGFASHNPTLLLAAAAVGGLGLLILAVVQSALYAIFQSAMYLHVTGEKHIDGFDRDQLTVALMVG